MWEIQDSNGLLFMLQDEKKAKLIYGVLTNPNNHKKSDVKKYDTNWVGTLKLAFVHNYSIKMNKPMENNNAPI
jgi:hypothetical protein